MRVHSSESVGAPKRILLYYDGTRVGRRALEQAALLVRENDSELHVLTVTPERLTPVDSDERAISDFYHITRQAALREARALLADQGINAHFEFREGYRDKEIADAARRYSVDLIVVPKYGSVPLIGRFFPSLADRVGRLIDIPLQSVG